MAREVLFFSPQVEDEGIQRQISTAGWDVHVARSSQDAHTLMDDRRFPVGLAEIPSGSAADWSALEDVFNRNNTSRWIALTSPHTLAQDAVCNLINSTFHDYHTLPCDLDRLLNAIGHAYGMDSLARLEEYQPAPDGEYEMVGSSNALLELFKAIRKIAGVEAPVLINGESGTGKELAALAIHERSNRASGPFIAVNCGALPANLIQSELFGHEKGSFTSAHQRKVGRIEAASGGTIFLDEIGDLPLDLQVNLLRFLQEKTIERVGSAQSIKLDVRVIAATNVDMERAVEQGRLREDLYYRLNVLNLSVPPLRERAGDIELLARFFFKKFISEKNKLVKDFSKQALAAMASYDWPGNIRELINRIRRAMVMCDRRLITPADLGLEKRHSQRGILTLEQARASAEVDAINNMMRQTKHNVSEAARRLGVSRVTLYRLAEKHQIGL